MRGTVSEHVFQHYTRLRRRGLFVLSIFSILLPSLALCSVGRGMLLLLLLLCLLPALAVLRRAASVWYGGLFYTIPSHCISARNMHTTYLKHTCIVRTISLDTSNTKFRVVKLKNDPIPLEHNICFTRSPPRFSPPPPLGCQRFLWRCRHASSFSSLRAP